MSPKIILVLLFLVLPLSTKSMANLSAENKPQVNSSTKNLGPQIVLDATSKVQGDFFTVVVDHVKSRPTVWFKSKEYETFQIGEGKYRALVPVENLTSPGAYSILAKANDWSEKIPVQVQDNRKGIQHITLTSDKDGLSATQKELNEIGRGFSYRSGTKFWQGKFSSPSAARQSSPFGVKRSYNNGPADSYHKGLDYAGDLGSPVLAPADGKVVVAGREKDGFRVHGNTVILDHGHGVTSIYMHLNELKVKEGDSVKKGDQIGTVGHTGISTGPHLHWGVYLYGTSVDPEFFLTRSVE